MPIDEVGSYISSKPKGKEWTGKHGLEDFDENGIRPILVVEESFRPGSISVGLHGRLPSNMMSLTQSMGATASWQNDVLTLGLKKHKEGNDVPRHHRILWYTVRLMVRWIYRFVVYTLQMDGVNAMGRGGATGRGGDDFPGMNELVDHYEEAYKRMGY